MKHWRRLLTILFVWAPWFVLMGLVVAADPLPQSGTSVSNQATPAATKQTTQQVEVRSPSAREPQTNATEQNQGVATDTQPSSDLLIASLAILVLAVFVGFEVISKVPPMLHTPLMSGSNAISGITVVGALVVTAGGPSTFASVLGMLAVIMAMTNVTGGFLVTHRMLSMFQKK